jgi:hypothetical protein
MLASQTLRDELVTQLQNEVNFLKNYLAKNKPHSLIGTKVTILPSQYMSDTLHLENPVEGIIVSELLQSNTSVYVFIKSGDNSGKIVRPFVKDLQFSYGDMVNKFTT